MAVTALPHAHENKINFLKYWSGFIFHGCCTLDVNLTVSYEITLVRLSIRPSVHLSLGFLKIGSLVFSDIVHDDSWPWDPVTDAATFLIKIMAARIWAKWVKGGPETFFLLLFSQVWFISIPWNDIQW